MNVSTFFQEPTAKGLRGSGHWLVRMLTFAFLSAAYDDVASHDVEWGEAEFPFHEGYEPGDINPFRRYLVSLIKDFFFFFSFFKRPPMQSFTYSTF